MAEQPTTTPWLVGRPRPAAALRLYCFPHSGGSPGEYLRALAAVPHVEVWAVHLPGRGRRLDEPAVTDLPTLVTAMVAEVRFHEPFVLLGHSLGALIAYEVAVRLRAEGRTGPQHLVASACPAPMLSRTTPPARHRSDAELAGRLIREHDALPQALPADPELLALTIAAYRADLHLLETYRYEHDARAGRLDCPVTAILGECDRVTVGQARRWGELTGEFGLRTLPGAHFAFRTHPAHYTAAVAEILRC